ncbi:MAG: DegV family protein [Firmicutes bacterium]|nr:DegV family protein [Bacillota bacterium]
MKFAISTDAGSDLDTGYLKANKVYLVSMKYTLDDGKGNSEHIFGNEGEGLTLEEFYALVKSGKIAKTTLINVEDHLAHFRKIIEGGAKEILHVSLSSALSGTQQNAVDAANTINAENKGVTIRVVNSKGASLGEGLMVDYAVTMRDSGKTLEEAAKWLEQNILKISHFFTVDDLNHLRRGGRLSGVAAFIGGLLGIKPILHVNNDGKLVALEKKRGRMKAIAGLAEKVKEVIDGVDQTVFICHADCEKEAVELKEQIEKVVGVAKFKIGKMGPIIGAHAGAGTLAVFFYGKNR